MRLRPHFSFVVGFVLWALSLAANAETVLITGANSGIGLEFAKQYAMRGSTVIATHRRDEPHPAGDVIQSLYLHRPNVVPDADGFNRRRVGGRQRGRNQLPRPVQPQRVVDFLPGRCRNPVRRKQYNAGQ